MRALIEPPVFGVAQAERAARLDTELRALTRHHVDSCTEYGRIVDAMFAGWEQSAGLNGVPFVPVGLFKRLALRSVPEHDVFKTVTSSGTSGQTASRVFLDRVTAARQTKVLALIMQSVLGPARRPMLIVDSDAVLTDRSSRTARAAGIVGLMSLGRQHTFVLDAKMQPQIDRVREFLRAHDRAPLFIFGFTFMVWEHLYKALRDSRVDLSNAVLVHSGGWKQMEAERVSNEVFKHSLRDAFGITQVVNFYGMAEQVGSVFLEGADGLLHPSVFADVIVRDPETLQPLPVGAPGVLQVLSTVPTSYPGHSILTEDLGVIEAIDSPATHHLGHAFRVLGRVPRTELRGCSDTYAAAHRG